MADSLSAIVAAAGRAALATLALLAPAAGASDSVPEAATAPLPDPVRRVLAALKLDENRLSVHVAPVDNDDPILSWNPDAPRNPASAIKLVTTMAALDVLGPAYRWETRAHALGPLSDGTLDGDLLLEGGGDPYLTAERFWTFLRALRARGVYDIAGDLLVDDSFFDVLPEDPRAFDGEPFRAYNVLPNALLVNFKAVSFQFFPDGNGVRIVPHPPLDNLKLDNRLRLVNRACRGFQRGVAFDLPNDFADGQVVFSGTFPSRCRAYSFSRTVLTHERYAWGLFRSLWREMGGSIDGTVRRGDAPEDERALYTMRSLTLAEIIRSVNKHSNNVRTRQLLYTLGAETAGPPPRCPAR
ncbi:MAG: D-alanyl-D-alanine carboxypeptidase, partial [Pseudomonadota bacterium]